MFPLFAQFQCNARVKIFIRTLRAHVRAAEKYFCGKLRRAGSLAGKNF
jgi:hypothetical protein